MSKTRRLLISVSGLEHWLQAADELPSGLKQFTARARIVATPDDDLPIAAALGLSNVPVAPLCRLAQDQADAQDHHWLRFDAVSLLPDLTAVWIQSPVALQLADASSGALVDEFGQMFQAENIAWQPDGPRSYGLIRLNDEVDCTFRPLDRVIGRRLDEVLPTGADQTRWRRMLNESQMIFHQQRALDHPGQQGLGLWFWGAGRLPKHAPSIGAASMACTQGVDALPDEWRGLARWLNIEVIDPSGYQPFTGTCMVEAGLIDAEAMLTELERRWIQPAWTALASGTLHELILVDRDRVWRVGRFGRWAFWRRNAFEPSRFESS